MADKVFDVFSDPDRIMLNGEIVKGSELKQIEVDCKQLRTYGHYFKRSLMKKLAVSTNVRDDLLTEIE